PAVGYLADVLSNGFIASSDAAGQITASCSLSDDSLSETLKATCLEAKAYGIKYACISAAALFGLAGVFFLLSGRTLVKDQYVNADTEATA
ncbi:MAG: MFS transporter, partial [Pseudomonadota bacterium]